MPELSRFYGIRITMNYDDHNPPYCHAEYNEYDVSIGIKPIQILEGSLPASQLRNVLKWANLYQDDLMKAWETTVENQKPPERIPPLP